MPRKPKTLRPEPPPTPPNPATPLDDDTETRILNAARAVFMRKGTAGARMQEIAAEAGVNQALVHYYFGSKDALAERVFMEAASRLAPLLASLLNPSATLEQMVERFVHAYIDTVRYSPFIPAYMLAEAHQHPDRLSRLMQKAVGVVPSNVAAAAIARLDSVIAERVAAGTMRPMPARQLLINVLSMVIMPFVARPVLLLAFGMDDAGFDEFLDERRRELPGFILNALRP